MKLYYAPSTCSLSPHIVMRELDLSFELVRVDNRTKLTADGRDFRTINAKGYVAALELEDGQILTEGPAIIQYLADLRPECELAPAPDSWARVRLQEWLSFINSEIHAGSAPLFNAGFPESVKTIFRERLFSRFSFLQETLARQPFLMGERFTVADAYLYTVMRWCTFFAIDLERWPALQTYMKRVGNRPAVQAALAVEAEK